MQGNYEKITTSEQFPAMIRYVDAQMLQQENWQLSSHHIPAHWHRSLEISLVTQGSVELYVHEQKHIIEENEFILVNSGFMHQLHVSSPQMPSVVIVIIAYEFVKDIIPHIDHILFDLSLSNQKKDRLREIYYELKQYCLLPEQYDEIKIKGYLFEILYILMKYYQIKDADQLTAIFHHQQHQYRILDYIEKHYEQPLTLEKMASLTKMNPQYFCRLFSKEFGVSFKSYLDNYRLYKAYHDIVNTKCSIEQIAYKHGFSNVKSFISRFKKLYGITPYQYRLKIKK